jgi:hypothetical protein
MRKYKIHRVDLSEEAWQGLLTMARSANYKQVAPFIMACAKLGLEFYDARPDEIRQATLPNQAEVFYDGSSRYQRTTGALPVAYLVTIAQRHHIRSHARQRVSLAGLDPARRIVTMHRQDSTWQLINAALEAIGLGYLRPEGILPSLKPVKNRKLVLDKGVVIM